MPYIASVSSPTIGSGDAQSIFTASSAQLLGIVKGTAAAPDTTLGPLLKAERLIQVNDNVIGGDGSEQLAALHGICVATAACQTQPVGVYGGAKTSSTDAGGTAGGNDATGIYGIGRITGSAIGYGIGGYGEGRRDTNTGKCYGFEARSTNQTATDGVYSPTAASDTMGLWVTAGGQSGRLNALAIGIAQVLGCQWDVGIGIVKIGGVSAVKSASFRDDGDAATSILINGSHATAAIAVAGQQPILIGETTRVTSSTLLEVSGPASTADPIAAFGHTGNSNDYSIFVRNSNGVLRLGIAGGTNSYITGTAAGDAVITPSSTKKLYLGRGTATITIDGATAGLGYFAHATATQQTVTGSRSANAALASLLTALAAYGLVVDSTTA